ncbi:hypothetical protein GQ53DRAFT_822696 [Thozetella sp. PMI_491]|nr:hypothetical protein GQ53DRAFT_822696 [Thozetella sp. PMI_491]
MYHHSKTEEIDEATGEESGRQDEPLSRESKAVFGNLRDLFADVYFSEGFRDVREADREAGSEEEATPPAMRVPPNTPKEADMGLENKENIPLGQVMETECEKCETVQLQPKDRNHESNQARVDKTRTDVNKDATQEW